MFSFYHMDSDVIDSFNILTTHWCVTCCKRVNIFYINMNLKLINEFFKIFYRDLQRTLQHFSKNVNVLITLIYQTGLLIEVRESRTEDNMDVCLQFLWKRGFPYEWILRHYSMTRFISRTYFTSTHSPVFFMKLTL